MIGFRRALWALGLAGFVAGLVPLCLALGNEDVADRALIAVFGPLVGWAFIGTGLFAWYRRPDNRFGPLMTAVGFTWCITGLAAADSKPLLAIGLAFGALPYGFLFHMLIAFPSGRLENRFERTLVVLGYFSTTVLQVAGLLFVDTTRDEICGDCPANPMQAFDNQDVADALIGFQSVLAISLLVGVGFVLWKRWREAGPSQRRVLGPVFGTGLLVALFVALSLLWDLTGFSDSVELAIDIAGLIAITSIPFGFLVGLLRSRFSRATAVSELVASLSDRDDRRRGLRDALSHALGDPGLTLAYWLPGSGELRDRRGTAVRAAGAGLGTGGDDHRGQRRSDRGDRARRLARGRARAGAGGGRGGDAWRSRTSGSTPSCARTWRSCAPRASAWWTPSSSAGGSWSGTCTTARSSASCRWRSRSDVARSKVEAGDAAAAKGVLDEAGEELDTALAELRELARGIHPAVLSDRGLDAALQSLAARAPLPVEVTEIPRTKLPDQIESAAYFVVAEALTNVAKYSQASRASIRVIQLNGRLIVEVSDDGVGGADPANGSGLRGLSDRVSALEGRLALQSEPGEGTTVMAWIPLR